MIILKKIGYLTAIFPLLLMFALPQFIMVEPWGGQGRYPWGQTLFACLLVILMCYLGYRWGKHWGLFKKDSNFFSRQTLLMIGVAYALTFGVASLGKIWLEALGKSETANNQELIEMMKRTPVIFNYLATACLPSVFEEFVCRGILMKKIFGFGRLKWVGLVLSSLIFAALHMPTDLPSWLIYTAPGLVMGYLYLKTDNLTYPATLHFINNFVSVLLFYLK